MPDLPRLAGLLRRIADRIDYCGAPKLTGFSFTFETGEGIRWRHDGRGCPVAYLGDEQYERAHSEADSDRHLRHGATATEGDGGG